MSRKKGVDRRDFLKVAGGVGVGLIAPIGRLPAEPVRTGVPWELFCDTDHHYFSIGKPWIRNGWKIATDARKIVRQRVDDADEFDERRVPYAKAVCVDPLPGANNRLVAQLAIGLPLTLPPGATWSPLPPLKPVFGWGLCPECGGSDKVGPFVPCPCTKKPNPSIVTHYSDWCGLCDGEQQIQTEDCPACKDATIEELGFLKWVPWKQRVRPKEMSVREYRVVLQLAGPLEYWTDDANCGPIFFRGADTEGSLMSLCDHPTGTPDSHRTKAGY